MPVHDFECPKCGRQILDRYQERLAPDPPWCVGYMEGDQGVHHEAVEMERLWTLSSGGAVKFREFDLHGHGTISSLPQLRQIEKASESERQPIAVRQYSMDKGRSGQAANVFGESPQPVAHRDFQTRTRRGIPFNRLVETK